MFFVRNDVLSAACNASTLPPFEALAAILPSPNPKIRLGGAEELARMVDVPLALQGRYEEARVKARADVQDWDTRARPSHRLAAHEPLGTSP